MLQSQIDSHFFLGKSPGDEVELLMRCLKSGGELMSLKDASKKLHSLGHC